MAEGPFGCRPKIPKKDLPPLPEIRDENIRLQVFTHRSFYARQTRLFEDHPGMNKCRADTPVKTSDFLITHVLDDPSLDNEMYVSFDPVVMPHPISESLRSHLIVGWSIWETPSLA